MESQTKADPTYVVGRSRREAARLQLQGQIYDPFMRPLLVDAGVTTDMKVLDVGCGAGDVSFLVADLVGSGGTVVGVDVNPTNIETARARAMASKRTNVTFVEADLREAPVPDDFDAMVGRLVLLHLRDAAEGLRAACRHVHPGGIVAFDEEDTTEGLIAVPPSPEYARVAHWIRAVLGRAGAELQMGFKLPRAFLDAGLPRPHLHLYAPMGSGPEWVGYEYLAQTIHNMLPLLVQYGIATEEEVSIDSLAERMRQEVVSQEGTAVLVHHVGAWTHKLKASDSDLENIGRAKS
jgi:ubiquinone/menaquinone biosynthesis C-methylase UbiE